MQDIYKELAIVLDRIPNGYPATESGVELEILAALFTPEEAELAVRLTTEPQTAKTIAQQIDGEERSIYAHLKAMYKKGLLDSRRGDGGIAFNLIPFVVGFWENQNENLEEPFARLFEKYYKEALHTMMAVKPSVHRVVPVEETIPVSMEIMPYKRASTYIENAKSWGVQPCICRKQKHLVGEGCDHTMDNCLLFSHKPNAFQRSSLVREITKEEAHDVLRKAADEGLVHSPENFQEGVTYICNCCSCCCAILRGVTELGHENGMGRSDFYAEIDADLCTGCGICVDRCQFSALEISENVSKIDLPRCYGCGLCIPKCPTGAISLKQKEPRDTEPPPVDEPQWFEQRAKNRGKIKESKK
ncbi:MAG: 4Fe-4S dicluster domain-containing protein [bacterium]|nr:4Fe-4S dicluster domain-containing protein [bacterium]